MTATVAPGSAIPRRRLARSSVEVAVLGGSIPDVFQLGMAPADDRAGQALLRRCVAEGIGLFDTGGRTVAPVAEELAAGAGLGDTAELATTLTGPGDAADVRLPGMPRPGGSPPPPALGPLPSSWADEVAGAVGRSLRRLQVARLAIAWIDASEAEVFRAAEVRDALAAEDRVAAWGVRFPAVGPPPEVVEGLLGVGVRLFGFAFHLLNAPEVVALVQAIGRAGGQVVDLDPHAGGRLNGNLLEEGRLRTSGGVPRPTDWATLRAQLEPVTRLGFLTQRRERTLGQAAIQYALGYEPVVSVLVPLGDPSRLAEWRGTFLRPELRAVDRREVEHPSSAPRNPPADVGDA